MSRPPYLFYSPRCVHCNRLIEEIKKNNQLSRVIEPINVHTASYLPPELNDVPAILFRGQLLIGEDTLKWVQLQTPQDNRPNPQQFRQNNGEQRPSIASQTNDNQTIMDNIPLPADVSSSTKTGIDYTPLPGQNSETSETLDNYTFLPGQGKQVDATDGLDYEAADEHNNVSKQRSNGIDQRMQQLQNLRGQDNDTIQQSRNPHGGSWQNNNPTAYMGANYGNMGAMTNQPGNYPPMNQMNQPGNYPPMNQMNQMNQGGNYPSMNHY